MDNLEPDKPNQVTAQILDSSMAPDNHTGYNITLLQFMGQEVRAKMELEMLESSSSSDEEDHNEKDDNKDDEEDDEVATDVDEPEGRLSRRNMILNMELVEELVEMRAVRRKIGKRVVFSEVVLDNEGGEMRTKGFQAEGEEEVVEEDYDADTE